MYGQDRFIAGEATLKGGIVPLGFLTAFKVTITCLSSPPSVRIVSDFRAPHQEKCPLFDPAEVKAVPGLGQNSCPRCKKP